MKRCVKCHKEIRDNAIFCLYCGTKVVSQGMMCQSCGIIYKDKDAKYCVQCGSQLRQNTQQSQKQHNTGSKINVLNDFI